jgi:hypothetical protein
LTALSGHRCLTEGDGQDEALADDAHVPVLERAVGVLADAEQTEEAGEELGPEAGVLEVEHVELLEDGREVVQGQGVLGLDLVDLAEVVEEALAGLLVGILARERTVAGVGVELLQRGAVLRDRSHLAGHAEVDDGLAEQVLGDGEQRVGADGRAELDELALVGSVGLAGAESQVQRTEYADSPRQRRVSRSSSGSASWQLQTSRTTKAER